MGRTPLVDFCNRNDPRARPRDVRTPRTAPAVARLRSSYRGWPRSSSSTRSREHPPSTANREFTGQGPSPGFHPTRHLPPRSLAAKASPQPDRLGHLLSQTRCGAGRSDLRRLKALRKRSAFGELARRDPLSRFSPLGPPPAFPREGKRDPPHPRCLPSPDPPFRVWAPPPPHPVPSLWSIRVPAPFRSSTRAKR